MTNISPAFFHGQIRTLEAIVDTINDGGSAMSTANEIAGWYVFDAARDGADNTASDLSADDFEAHLEFLIDAGAQIDDRSAVLRQAAQYQTDSLAA